MTHLKYTVLCIATLQMTMSLQNFTYPMFMLIRTCSMNSDCEVRTYNYSCNKLCSNFTRYIQTFSAHNFINNSLRTVPPIHTCLWCLHNKQFFIENLVRKVKVLQITKARFCSSTRNDSYNMWHFSNCKVNGLAQRGA